MLAFKMSWIRFSNQKMDLR